ncbi:MAG: response regulator transcription factor [Chloroflexales bacterium]|nr:response regulator transcription factor [Chloroflexales bacterium]
MSQPAKILVVDDEANIRLTLSALLTRAGYAVTTASSGEEAIEQIDQQPFDLLLVDLKMPRIGGMQVVAAVRERGLDIVMIVLTGHGSLDTAIEGLHQGIFDYMLKTSDPNHVVERVKEGLAEREQRLRQRKLIDTVSAAVQELRGESAPASAEAASAANERVIAIGELQLDTWRQVATLAGRSLSLTPTEFRVLLCLAEHAGQMLSYTQLVRCAQGYEASELEAGELIKPHIHHLRQKLEPNPVTPRYLLNVRGKGYILQIDEA